MNDENLETMEDSMPNTEQDAEPEITGGDIPAIITGAEGEPVTNPEIIGEGEAETVDTSPKKRGPKSIFEREGGVEAALLAIHAGAAPEGEKMPTRFIEKQLAEAGLVYFQAVKTPGAVGRPRHVAYLTGAGLVRIGFTE